MTKIKVLVFSLVIIVGCLACGVSTSDGANTARGNKVRVSPICAATKNAWSSTSQCNALKSELEEKYASKDSLGKMIKTALEEWTEPIYATMELNFPDCVDKVIEENGIRFACTYRFDIFSISEGQAVGIAFCPQGYLAVQSRCTVKGDDTPDGNYLIDGGDLQWGEGYGAYMNAAFCTADTDAYTPPGGGIREPKPLPMTLRVTCQRAGAQLGTTTAKATGANVVEDPVQTVMSMLGGRVTTP
jgi:hypothetical protein